MKDAQIWALDIQGSLQAVRANPDGALLSALDVSDITLDTDLDSLNGTTIAVGSGVANAGTLRVIQALDAVSSINVSTQDISLGVFQASGFASSVNILQLAGTGTAVNSGVAGDGVLRIVHVTDVGTSAEATGNVAHDGVDSGNPVKIGGVARTANPTAVASGDRADLFVDDVGRPVMQLYQVRDLIATASVQLDNAVETTLLAGAASTFHDLIEISFSNGTASAHSVALRSATAAGVVKTFRMPANDTRSFTFPASVPQNAAADAWTAAITDPGVDESGATMIVSAVFVKNV